MKSIIIILASFLSMQAMAQDAAVVAKSIKKHKWQLGVSFSPDMDFRLLYKGTDGVRSPKFGYTTGVGVNYNFTKVISLEGGVQYSQRGFATTGPLIYTFASSPSQTLTRTLNYIDIPLRVNFIAGKKAVRFMGSVGVTTNFLIVGATKSVYTTQRDQLLAVPEPVYRKVNLSPTIAAGIDYKINSRFNLRVQPTFAFGMISIQKNVPASYLCSAGISTAFYFGL